MKAYFILQYRLMNRKLRDFGLFPIVGYLLITLFFIMVSIFLFHKIEFAEYFFIFFSLCVTSRLSETKRTDFLKLCFGKQISMIRIIENLIISVPFIAFLVYKQCFISAGILLSISSLMALTNLKTSFNVTIPTPFYKKPFEFTVGFRNTFYIFVIAYCLTIIAVFVDNFSLGIFSLLLVFFTVCCYYFKAENEYYVWIYAMSPKKFLFEKMKTGCLFSSIIGLPIVLLLGLCFFENTFFLLMFFVFGHVFLLTVILMKYSAYPNEINLPQIIFFTLSLLFPPLLLVVIPVFFNQSIKQLENFLK